jgi:hypothetical protein
VTSLDEYDSEDAPEPVEELTILGVA